MDKISYKLPIFEGPMDLLLHLINKHKLNIYDIPILELVEQYVVAVCQMQADENLEVASEFLEMAARLVYLKTVSLLPVHEEADQLKKELTGELLEYRDCQLMAQKLAEHTDGFDHYTREPQVFEVDPTYTRLHEPDELLSADLSAVGKGKRRLPPPVESFTGIVSHKIVSVGSKVAFILRRLIRGQKQRLESFFEIAPSRSDMVATFLAMLELMKARRIRVDGDGEAAQVLLLRRSDKSSHSFTQGEADHL